MFENELMSTFDTALDAIAVGGRDALDMVRAYQIWLTRDLFGFGQYPFFPIINTDRHCLVCLSSECRTLCCGHLLCSDCYKVIGNGAIVHSMSLITIHSVTFIDAADMCPFCHKACI